LARWLAESSDGVARDGQVAGWPIWWCSAASFVLACVRVAGSAQPGRSPEDLERGGLLVRAEEPLHEGASGGHGHRGLCGCDAAFPGRRRFPPAADVFAEEREVGRGELGYMLGRLQYDVPAHVLSDRLGRGAGQEHPDAHHVPGRFHHDVRDLRMSEPLREGLPGKVGQLAKGLDRELVVSFSWIPKGRTIGLVARQCGLEVHHGQRRVGGLLARHPQKLEHRGHVRPIGVEHLAVLLCAARVVLERRQSQPTLSNVQSHGLR